MGREKWGDVGVLGVPRNDRKLLGVPDLPTYFTTLSAPADSRP